MYNDIIKKLPSLSHKELKELHKAVEIELSYRESKEPINYKCPECPFEGAFGEVYNHLRAEHASVYEDEIKAIYAPKGVYA